MTYTIEKKNSLNHNISSVSNHRVIIIIMHNQYKKITNKLKSFQNLISTVIIIVLSIKKTLVSRSFEVYLENYAE